MAITNRARRIQESRVLHEDPTEQEPQPLYTYYGVRRNPADGLWSVYKAEASAGECVTPGDNKANALEKLMRYYR